MITQKLVVRQKIYSTVEVLFLLSASAYIMLLVYKTTMFRIELPLYLSDLLFRICEITAIVKCDVLLWSKPKERQNNLVLVAAAVIMAVVYFLVYNATQYSFLRFLAFLSLGMVGTKYYKFIKLHVCVTGIVVLAAIVAALSGIITNLVYSSTGWIGSAWGILYTTDYASYFVYLCIAAWVAWKRVPDWVFAILSGISFLNACFIARSRTSMIASLLLVVIMAGCSLAQIIARQRKDSTGGELTKRFISSKRMLSWLVSLAFPVFCLTMLVLMFCYAKGMAFAYSFDTLFSNRLSLAVNAYHEHGLSLFGLPFGLVGNGATTHSQANYNFLDSSYHLILLRYGAVLLLALAVLWTLMSRKAIKHDDWRLAFALAIIAFHSISEHHFVDVNYNAFIILPFSVFGMDSAERVEQSRKSDVGTSWCKRAGGGLTVVMFAVLLCFIAPAVLRRIRTAWDVTPTVEQRAVMEPIFWTLLLGLMAVIVLVFTLYRAASALFDHRSLHITLFAQAIPGMVFVVAVGVLCSNQITRYEYKYLDSVLADNGAIEAIQLANGESGGRLFSNELPELYEQVYGGFSTSLFAGDDLARYKNISVITDANYESPCFFSRGFLYTQISDEHAIYTNDQGAISNLRDAGYHLTGYYSKRQSVNLEEVANLNDLPTTEDGALILQGEGRGHSLLFGPSLELWGGDYTVTYDLSIQPDAYDSSKDNDFALGYLRISTGWNKTIIKKTPILRSQFGESGAYSAELRCKIGDASGVEFLVFMNPDCALFVHSITYQKTPEYDTHITIDDMNRKVREEYYDLDGNPFKTKEGYAACAYMYDNADNISLTTYLDEEGRPVIIGKGYAKVGRMYDSRKLVIREAYYDEQGEPIMLDGGYASQEYTYDTNKNRVETRNFGIDGQLVMLPTHYSIVRKTYDEKRRVTREEYFDTDDMPVKIRDGYAIAEHTYDDSDNEIILRVYDESGKPILNTNGYAEVHRDYDIDKHVTREVFYGADGNLVALKSGQTINVYQYDIGGNRTDSFYYDAMGQLTFIWDSYAGVHNDFNDKKQAVREWYYDVSGKMMLRDEGYSIVEREYDEDGNASALVYADTKGDPVMRTDGYAKVKRVFNTREQVIREEYYDTGGNPCIHKNGYFAVEYDYDPAGNRTEYRYYDINGSLANNKDGHAVAQHVFDEYGNLIKKSYFDSKMKEV